MALSTQPDPARHTPHPDTHTSQASPGRRPWARFVGYALIPVVFTAAGQAVSQVQHLDPARTLAVTAAFVALSAVLGLGLAARRPGGLSALGVHRGWRWWGWLIPAVPTVAITVAITGVRVSTTTLVAAATLCLAVAVNEEVFYRGLLISLMRPWGVRFALVAASTGFAVLHLTNLAGGVGWRYALLQVVFAALFGLVAGQIYLITESLVPAIIWHACYDLASYAGGDQLTTATMIGAAANCLLLLGCAVAWWRRSTSGSTR